MQISRANLDANGPPHLPFTHLASRFDCLVHFSSQALELRVKNEQITTNRAKNALRALRKIAIHQQEVMNKEEKARQVHDDPMNPYHGRRRGDGIHTGKMAKVGVRGMALDLGTVVIAVDKCILLCICTCISDPCGVDSHSVHLCVVAAG